MKENALKAVYRKLTWDPIQKEMVLLLGTNEPCAVKAETLLDWRKSSLQPPKLHHKDAE